jgi:hypothetical protein
MASCDEWVNIVVGLGLILIGLLMAGGAFAGLWVAWRVARGEPLLPDDDEEKGGD